ncbi:MAG: hypothetical protein ACRD3Q_17080 [Terriglobales bacterium]
MKPVIAAAAAGLITVMLAAGCGNSASVSSASAHPSYASRLASYGDTVGTSATAIGSPTPAKLIAGMERMDGTMGPDWLQEVCQAQSDATVVGIKFAKAEADFAKGYDITAPAGSPSARAVFASIVAVCGRNGLR